VWSETGCAHLSGDAARTDETRGVPSRGCSQVALKKEIALSPCDVTELHSLRATLSEKALAGDANERVR